MGFDDNVGAHAQLFQTRLIHCKRQNNRVGTRKLPDFSNRFLRKVREFSYSSSSENADGSMSIIGSSGIMAASFAASGFSLMSAGTDSDHGISESR